MSTNLQPESQNCVTVSSKRYGPRTVELHSGLYLNHQCLTTAVIHHLNPGQRFKVLTANFIKSPVKLNVRQVVSIAYYHPDIITKSNITHAEMLGITTTTYTKRDKNVRDVETVNKHLADARLVVLGNQDEQTITSENMEIHAPK